MFLSALTWDNIIAIISTIIAIPAMIIGIYNCCRNRFHLACFFQVTKVENLFDDLEATQPCDYCRIYGILDYINYSPIDFYIIKIELRINDKSYMLEQENYLDKGAAKFTFPFVPFKNIPLYQRSSDNIKLCAEIPKLSDLNNAQIYVYTSYRKKPYDYPVTQIKDRP